MKNFKHNIMIVLMFFVLLAVVYIPLLYMEYQNNRLLNKVVISPAQTTHLDDKEDIAQNYNIWERIGILNHSAVIRTLAPMKFKAEDATGEDKSDPYQPAVAEKEGTILIQMMEKQLETLKNYNALPLLSFSDAYSTSIYKETYMDNANISNSRLTFSVWVIYAEYPDFYVYVYMDTETAALYDITIFTKHSDFVYQTGLSENGFLEYLKAI